MHHGAREVTNKVEIPVGTTPPLREVVAYPGSDTIYSQRSLG